MLAGTKQVSEGTTIDARATHDRGSGPRAAPGTGPDGLTAAEAAPRLGAEMVRLMRLAAAWKHLAKYEAGGADRLLLARLVMDGPRRATDLAADTLLDLSTVSRRTRALVDRGLVERRPDPEDGRGALLTATEAGFAALEQYRRERDSEVAAILQGWPPEDRFQLVRLLTHLNDDLLEHHNERQCPGGRSGVSAENREK
jgi:DNA-binding MarR family transcriptional regulator